MKAQGYRIVLVSGSNLFCVNSFLENHELKEYFDETFCPGITYCHVQ